MNTLNKMKDREIWIQSCMHIYGCILYIYNCTYYFIYSYTRGIYFDCPFDWIKKGLGHF